jgi:hypothetical protein
VRYKQFWPGDKVMTIVDYAGVPSGSVGKIASRWLGTVYLVRATDGTFRWINSSAFRSIDPHRHDLKAGDMGRVTLNEHRYDFAKVGDILQVVKVAYDVDYYGIFIDDELNWFGGFQLALYIPSESL